MPTETCPSRPSGPRLGASALLLLSVALVVSFEQIRPMMRELQRETATERAAVRELAASLAKAVRQLAGDDGPRVAVALAVSRDWSHVREPVLARPVLACGSPVRPVLPRAELLDLPPPSRA